MFDKRNLRFAEVEEKEKVADPENPKTESSDDVEEEPSRV